MKALKKIPVILAVIVLAIGLMAVSVSAESSPSGGKTDPGKKQNTTPSSSTVSPKTGVSTNWVYFAVVGGVLAGVAVAVARRKAM